MDNAGISICKLLHTGDLNIDDQMANFVLPFSSTSPWWDINIDLYSEQKFVKERALRITMFMEEEP